MTEQKLQPSDEELMLAVAAGDPGAFDAIVARHQDHAWRVARRFAGDAAQAEDLAQEAFLRILEAAPRYEPSGDFRAYLLRVLSRLCMDFRRKKRPVSVGEGILDRAGPKPPDLEAVEEEDRRLVRAAMDGLPANQRMAVILRYFEGLDAAETAKALEITPKAVERLLHKARKKLAGKLRNLH